MADREVESSDVEVPEIPEILEKVLLFSLDEAKEKMTQGSDVVPFTALVVKETASWSCWHLRPDRFPTCAYRNIGILR